MKAFKLFTASAMALSLLVATVACCCIGAGVKTHFHKPAAMCCEKQGPSHQGPSNQHTTCVNYLTNFDVVHAQTALQPLSVVFVPTLSMGTTHAQFLAAFPQIYSRGSPPLIGSIPIYIQIRNLRI